MIKVDYRVLASMDREHPGLMDSITAYEHIELPRCPRCNSRDTALVHAGVTPRSALIQRATTKFHLTDADLPPGHYYCNHCIYYFE